MIPRPCLFTRWCHVFSSIFFCVCAIFAFFSEIAGWVLFKLGGDTPWIGLYQFGSPGCAFFKIIPIRAIHTVFYAMLFEWVPRHTHLQQNWQSASASSPPLTGTQLGLLGNYVTPPDACMHASGPSLAVLSDFPWVQLVLTPSLCSDCR